MNVGKIPAQQRQALHYLQRHQTPVFGVIVKYSTANGLLNRGLAEIAERRPYARSGGICLRLTEEGERAIRIIEGTERADT